MRRLIDRSQIPPLGMIVTFVVLLVALEILSVVSQFTLAVPLDLATVRTTLVLVSAIGLSLWRAFSHPIFHRKYCRWLASTPWDPTQRLPLCRLRPHFQDIGIMALLVLASHNAPNLALAVPVLYVGAYSTVIALVLISTGTWQYGYLLIYGLGLLVLGHQNSGIVVCVAVGLYLIAHFGITRSLQGFPWAVLDDERSHGVSRLSGKQPVIGWPFPSLRAESNSRYANIRLWPHVFLGAFLPGYFFVIGWSFVGQAYPRDFLFGNAVQIVVGTAGARLVFYLAGHSPLLLGRLATGQWYAPRFDQVFITPLLIIAYGPALTMGMLAVGFHSAITLGVTFGVCLCLAFAGPPSYEKWQLTSSARPCNTSKHRQPHPK